jgi:hypothetical protein
MSNSGVDAVLQTSSILVDDFCFGIGKPPTLERFPKVLKSQSMGFGYQGRRSVRDGKVTVGSGCVRAVHPHAREELQAKETCARWKEGETC